jgi:hypothetical protein
MRSLALTRLDSAYALRHAAHRMGLRASGPDEPNLPQQIATQRKALFALTSSLLEKDFETEMDQLVACWKEYREAQNG